MNKIILIITLIGLIILISIKVSSQNHHEWRKQGECLECHSQEDPAIMASPKYHSVQFRRYTHGRISELTSIKCYACHEISTCQACHNRMPESHTESFVSGMARHILLGRIRPSSCLVCHQSFVSACTKCHMLAEVSPWENDAKTELLRWKELHANLPNNK